MSKDHNNNHDQKPKEFWLSSTTSIAYSSLLTRIKSLQTKQIAKAMKELRNEYFDISPKEVLKHFIVIKSKKNAEVIRDAAIGKDYFYSIYRGKRKPSRDKTLQLGFGLELTFDEMNLFLKKLGHNELYLRNERDFIVSSCLNNKETIFKTDELLEEMGYQPICPEN